jgi:hypothetical protein
MTQVDPKLPDATGSYREAQFSAVATSRAKDLSAIAVIKSPAPKAASQQTI